MAAATSETARPAFAVGRVVVALDAQCDHLAAIETACEFAGRWRCAMAGIFVVGSDLVRLCLGHRGRDDHRLSLHRF